MSSDNSGTNSIESVTTAFSILETLKEGDGLRLTDVADELSLAKSTAHRYLTTLTNQEYVVREGDKYHIGLRCLSLGTHARNRQPGYELVKPKVAQVAHETGERAQFVVSENGKAVYLHRELGEHAVRINLEIGERIPLHAISPGKAIMAEWPNGRIDEYIQTYGLTELTDQTITDRDTLYEELAEIRDRGYSINHEEFVDEINSVGVSIVDPNGSVLGAISVSGPTHRMQGSRFQTEIPELLMGTAHELELNLKYGN